MLKEDPLNENELQDLGSFCEKYEVSNEYQDSPRKLLDLLKKIDNDGFMSREERNWLDSLKQYRVLAIHFEQYWLRKSRIGVYDKYTYWALINSCSYWRKAHRAIRGIELTDVQIQDNWLMSALLTTRGGAFRDIRNWGEAKKCGYGAMDSSPGMYHPHNLLGAICYQLGQPSEGDEHFSKALELQAPPRSVDQALKAAIEKAEPDEQEKDARHLLKKDPERYWWAQQYIHFEPLPQAEKTTEKRQFTSYPTETSFMTEEEQFVDWLLKDLDAIREAWSRSCEDGWFYTD